MTAPYLTIESVTKTFDDFVAIQDINLDVFPGEFICFLGPSGCGKTTLLRAIAGLDIQSRGRIVQDKVDISALPPEQRDFGIVFQSYALFPNLTVAKNIAWGLDNLKWDAAKKQARVEELLATVGLEAHADKYPAQISGGQQQRVALARALAMSPGLLLLDEPLSALDAKVRHHLRGELKALQRQLGVTTIMVTHDQDEALALADRIVVMNMGVIEQVGTPEEVYSKPASAFVADFIGAMNIVDATCDAATADAACRLHIGDMVLEADQATSTPSGPVKLAVRPEDIRVDNFSADGRNQVSVTITGMEFMGSFYRASLQSDAFGDVLLSGDFSANLVRSRGLEPGQTLTIELPANQLHVFDGTAARETVHVA